ncbi:MAG: hypothetical protein JST84_05335 [Acidobacteria bacterium]|nr:hypothetical protein [Acidobacteriota bacterium]
MSQTTKTPTKRQREALDIIAAYPGLTAARFAELLWPESDGWKRVKNTGNGACHGKGMWLAGGCYLAKLVKLGWVRRGDDFRSFHLTAAGHSQRYATQS